MTEQANSKSRLWSAEDVEYLKRRYYTEKAKPAQIDRELGRFIGSSSQKIAAMETPQFRHHRAGDSAKPDQAALSDRDARLSLVHSNLTAMLLGDPLPGRSALDQRRASA